MFSAGSVLDGLAVDPLSRLMFYADAGRHVIGMVTLSSFAQKIVINSSLDQPRALVLDPRDGYCTTYFIGSERCRGVAPKSAMAASLGRGCIFKTIDLDINI